MNHLKNPHIPNTHGVVIGKCWFPGKRTLEMLSLKKGERSDGEKRKITDSDGNCSTARPHCDFNSWDLKAHSGSEVALVTVPSLSSQWQTSGILRWLPCQCSVAGCCLCLFLISACSLPLWLTFWFCNRKTAMGTIAPISNLPCHLVFSAGHPPAFQSSKMVLWYTRRNFGERGAAGLPVPAWG